MPNGRRRRPPAHRHSRTVVRPGVLGDRPKRGTVSETLAMFEAMDGETRFAMAATFLQDIETTLEALSAAIDDDSDRAAAITGGWLSRFADNPKALTGLAMIAFEFDAFGDAIRAPD